jgi:glutamate--cysteine ligase
MTGICEVLDHGDPLRPYTTALAVQSAKLDNVSLTPSARLLNELTSTGESFFDQALRMSTFHKEYFLDLYAPNQDRLGEFRAEAEESLERQAQLENSNDGTFDAYLARYFAK